MCTLGERIRARREAYGMSQAELSRRIGISKQSMNSIEQGETPDPRVSRIVAIATTLGVTSDALLGLSNHEHCTATPSRTD